MTEQEEHEMLVEWCRHNGAEVTFNGRTTWIVWIIEMHRWGKTYLGVGPTAVKALLWLKKN